MKRKNAFVSFGVFNQILLALFFIFNCPEAQAQKNDSVIEVHAVLETVEGNLFLPEAIVVAESGDKIVFLAKAKKGLLPTPPSTAWIVRRDPATGSWNKPEQLLDKGVCNGIAFGNSDKWLIATQDYFALGALQNLGYVITDREKIGDLRGYKHRLEILDVTTKQEIMSFTPADFGLKKNEILKHARVSPDGKWLSFYLHSYKQQRGIYLYNFEMKKTYHLALEDDKHPTWTPDGTKIFFHNQRGGNAHTDEELNIEEARLGYFDLKFEGSNVTWQRILIDPASGPAVYHKHPSIYSGTDLVFFHKKHREDKKGKIELSSSSLYVRQLGISTQVYKIKDLYTVDSLEVKTIKHVASAATLKSTSGLFFVGKAEDKNGNKDAEYKIYHAADKDIQKIAAEMKRLESLR